MPTFTAADGTLLTYYLSGNGADPVVCLPGGPMQASAYLSDMPVGRPTARLDLRGTGSSAAPAGPASYWYDRQVEDAEALRSALGLSQMTLLGHSAGASLAVLYAARHPERVRRLVLVTPSPRPVGVEVTDEDRRGLAELRRDEAWFPDAWAAFTRIWAGSPTADDWAARPCFLGASWRCCREADISRGSTTRRGSLRWWTASAAEPDAHLASAGRPRGAARTGLR